MRYKMKASEAKKICEKWLESVSEISIRWFLGSARERQYFSPVLDMDDAGIISDVEMEKTFDGGIGVLSIYARRVDLDNFQNPDRFCVFHYDLTNDSWDNLLASEQYTEAELLEMEKKAIRQFDQIVRNQQMSDIFDAIEAICE